MRKQRMLRAAAAVCAAVLLAAGLPACSGGKEPTVPGSSPSAQTASAAFVPQLDTQAAVSLEAGVAFGNFEALDQVINAFNEVYPNVTITYEQASGNKIVEYLKNNPNADIVMTDDTNIRYPDWADSYVLDQLADLSAEGVHASAVRDDLLEGCTIDGKLARIPMGQILYGIVVNKTLLEKEGLSVPTNYQELLDVCETLKQAGYTPIQGPESSVYGDLGYNMAMAELGTDADLLAALNNGDEAAVTALQKVFERVEELKAKGYLDPAVNAEYPDDNYDGAILKFFEGDVPFWVCNTEKVSGMKKRESKSEAFSASPFEYQFLYAPMADDGVCAYVEPWVGFSVNQNSDVYDYAVEFIRFLAQEDQLNTLASVKGVPSAAKNSSDEQYTAVRDPEDAALSFVNDGTILNHMKDYFRQDANKLGMGEYTSAREAAEDYVQRCAEVAQSMAERS